MTVQTGTGPPSTFPFPADGVFYVANGNSSCSTSPCTTSYSPFNATYPTSSQCGNVIVRGTYSGQLTIAAENDIIIDEDITRTGAGLLGLVANNFVRVKHPFAAQTTRGNCNGGSNGTGTINDLRIDAAILAIQHSFIVDHYDCGASLGQLEVNGAICAEVPRSRRHHRRTPATSRTTTTTTACGIRSRRTSSTPSSPPGTSSARRSTSPDDRARPLRVRRRHARRQLRERRRPPRPSRRAVGVRPFALPGLRHADRGLRQRPDLLLAAAAWSLPRLRRADLGPLSASRARHGRAVHRDRDRPRGRRSRAARPRADLLRAARHDHAHRPRAADHPQRDPGGRRRRRDRDRRRRPTPRASPSARIAALGAGGFMLAVRDRLPARDGNGRRQARRGDGPVPRPGRDPGPGRRGCRGLARRASR